MRSGARDEAEALPHMTGQKADDDVTAFRFYFSIKFVQRITAAFESFKEFQLCNNSDTWKGGSGDILEMTNDFIMAGTIKMLGTKRLS